MQVVPGQKSGRIQDLAGHRRVRDLRQQEPQAPGQVLQGHGRREQRMVWSQPGKGRSPKTNF